MMKQKKLVPKRRFEGFTNKWKEEILEEVVQINMGQSPNSENYTENPNDHILVQGNADMKNNRVVPRVWTTQVTKKVEKNDIILSVRAPVGDVGKTDYDAVLGRGVAGIKGNEFIFQLLVRMKEIDYWSKLSTGSTFESINSNDIKEAYVLIPNDEEQQKIGQFFKHLDEMITLEQRKIDKTKALKSAYLAEMFPAEGECIPKRRFEGFTEKWKKYKFENVADMFNNLRIPVTASERIPGDTPYYGANGIQDYVKGSTHDGEFVLVAEDGANDLSNYPVQYVNGKVWVNNHAHVITGKNNIIDNLFLISRMKSMDISKWLVGGGRAKLNAEVLKNIQIEIPNFEEQKQIGLLFKQLDNIIVTHQQKLEKLKATKQAYLHEMFV